MERTKRERSNARKGGKDDLSWSSLRRVPFPAGFLEKLQQSNAKKAMELIKELLSKAASETLSELTANTVANATLEARDFALARDSEAREKHEDQVRMRAAKQMKAIVTKNIKGVGESAEEEEAPVDTLGSTLGAGWLDICIKNNSGKPADDNAGKRSELAQFIRTMGSLQVDANPVASLCAMRGAMA